MFPPPGHKALRKGRTSLPGQIYLLTTTTARRKPLFTDPACAQAVCEVMQASACWRGAQLLCWVLMPDHWHGLLRLEEATSLSCIMNTWKSVATRTLHRQGIMGSIWARGFHDHALRHDENVITAARYIIANPVRANLVAAASEYPYWGCIWHTDEAPL